jgi:hypothetical protein
MGTIRHASQGIFRRRLPRLVIRQALDLGLKDAHFAQKD